MINKRRQVSSPKTYTKNVEKEREAESKGIRQEWMEPLCICLEEQEGCEEWNPSLDFMSISSWEWSSCLEEADGIITVAKHKYEQK